jgi:tripeptidyl-peptidase-1
LLVRRCGCGIDGTSASAPLWNGIITLLNDWRFNHGLPSVGFINPLIYAKAATPALFQDIVTGNNGCSEQVCCPGQVTFSCWLNGVEN